MAEVKDLRAEINSLKGLVAEKEHELKVLHGIINNTDWKPREGLYVKVEGKVGVIWALSGLDDDSPDNDRAQFTYLDDRLNQNTITVALSACRPL